MSNSNLTRAATINTSATNISATMLSLETNCRIQHDVKSDQLTTFGVGQGARLLVEPESIEALLEILPKLDREPRILGNGSNLVMPDNWILQPLIRLPKRLTGAVDKDSALGERLSQFPGRPYYAGSSLINLSRTLCQAGLKGFEFAAGIPGTLGGAIKMNAGAHGASISEVITGVVVSDFEGRLQTLDLATLDFSYRHSSVTDKQIILAASILVPEGDSQEIRERRQSCLDYRTRTQPLKMPSAGSVFRNPVDSEKKLEAAAFYLEKVGLKGFASGGVGYSTLHANWLVRLDDSARAEAVHGLIELGKKRVFEEYGLSLTPEILLW